MKFTKAKIRIDLKKQKLVIEINFELYLVKVTSVMQIKIEIKDKTSMLCSFLNL